MDADERKIQIAHLEAIREDLRGEIKQRIVQRDTYIIQVSLGLAAVVGFASAQNKPGLVILAPLVSLYYTYLIAYSYRVHEAQTKYLREVLEPSLRSLCATANDEWETWYQAKMAPGRRRNFLVWGFWAVCVLSPAFVYWAHVRLNATKLSTPEILVAMVVYLGLAVMVKKWLR